MHTSIVLWRSSQMLWLCIAVVHTYYATSETCVTPLSPGWHLLVTYEEITLEFVKFPVVCRLATLHTLPIMLILHPSSTPAAYSNCMTLLIFSTVRRPLLSWSLRLLCYLLTYDYASIILIWSFLHLIVLYSFHLLLSVYSRLGYMTPILMDFSIKTSCIYSEKQQEVYSFIVHLKDFAFTRFLPCRSRSPWNRNSCHFRSHMSFLCAFRRLQAPYPRLSYFRLSF